MTALTDKRAALVEAHRCMLDCARVGNTQAAAEWGLRLVDLTLDMSEARTIAMLDARGAGRSRILPDLPDPPGPELIPEDTRPCQTCGLEACAARKAHTVDKSPPEVGEGLRAPRSEAAATPEGEAGAEGPDVRKRARRWAAEFYYRPGSLPGYLTDWIDGRNEGEGDVAHYIIELAAKVRTPLALLDACEAKLRDAEARVAELEHDAGDPMIRDVRETIAHLRTKLREAEASAEADPPAVGSRLWRCEVELEKARTRAAELETAIHRVVERENACVLCEERIATIERLTRERDEARARQATLAATADRMTEAAREAIVTRQSAERERDEALAALRESEASHEDPVWEELRALAHDALSIEAKLSAQRPATPARLDESRTAEPKTRLVGHAHAGDRIGPGSVAADTHVDNETGKRTGLGGDHPRDPSHEHGCPGCVEGHAPEPEPHACGDMSRAVFCGCSLCKVNGCPHCYHCYPKPAPEPAKATERRWGVWVADPADAGWYDYDDIPVAASEAEARAGAVWLAATDGEPRGCIRYEARPLPETEET